MSVELSASFHSVHLRSTINRGDSNCPLHEWMGMGMIGASPFANRIEVIDRAESVHDISQRDFVKVLGQPGSRALQHCGANAVTDG